MAGISLQSATVTETGFAFDRYWMLVDIDGNCLTQREFPKMALFQVGFMDGGIRVTFQGDSIFVSNTSSSLDILKCHIWEDTVLAIKEPNEISKWFSRQFGHEVFLVRMATNSVRHVKRHAPATVHFPDSSPYLIVGEKSLNLLNDQLISPISMDRFRPNIVFTGGKAHEEDRWQRVTIGNTHFESTKLCPRCTVTTIDQKTAEMGEEPLLQLSKYRLINRKIMFGHYFKSVGNLGEQIGIGDTIAILRKKEYF